MSTFRSATIQLEGTLDLSNVMKVLALPRSCLQRGKALALDLSRVTWIDSAGLAGLVRLLAEARKIGGEFHLSDASDTVREALAFARLDTLFPVAKAS